MDHGRIHRLLTAVVLGALSFACPKISSAETKGKGIERPAIGQKLRSPDGRFTVSFEEMDNHDYFYRLRVTDKKTSESRILDSLTTSSALYWTGDSQTVIAVILLSGGPLPMVYHFKDDGTWKDEQVAPSSEYNKKQCLIACQPQEHRVLFTFSVSRWSLPKYDGKYYELTWDYDPISGFVNDETLKPVSEKQFDKRHRRYFLD